LSAEVVRRSLGAFVAAVALAGLAVGCTSSGSGQTSSGGNAFVFLTIDRIAPASVQSNLGQRQASTQACVTLRNTPKNPTLTTPTALDNVVITEYTVSFARMDSGAAPGPFTFNTAFLVPASTGTGTNASPGGVNNVLVVLLPAQAKSQAPLAPPPLTPVSGVATVVFKGEDGRGQRVETQGSVSVTFIFDQETAETAPSC
jgi:hypothetical protein